MNVTYLFVPAKKMSIIEKAIKTESENIIIDLEDAVAASEKEEAREIVKIALSEFHSDKDIFIRINDYYTKHWQWDLATAIKYGANGIVVPKSENPDHTKIICDKSRALLQDYDRNTSDFKIIPLIESAKGIEFAYQIANSDSLIDRLAFGSIDFSLDVGCELTESGEELLYARSKLVIASKASGIKAPIDAVYPQLNNETGLINETTRAKKIGFGSKLIIHPKQIHPVKKIFLKSESELKEARLIVEAFESAESKGSASIKINDQFVDYPVYKKAKELIQNFSGGAKMK